MTAQPKERSPAFTRSIIAAGVLMPVLLVAFYAARFSQVIDDGMSEDRSAGEQAAEQGLDAKAAFRKAIALAPICEDQDFSDQCTGSGRFFLEAYLEGRPEAKTELCVFARGEPQGDAREWAAQRCVELGHAGQGCCREAHRWLAQVCP